MPRLVVFNHVTLDGYFTDMQGDMSWAHDAKPDAEWSAFVNGNASGGGRLIFGRVTYQMMASYWPTAQAHESNPTVAKQMDGLPKVVFSKTLDSAAWNNTRLVKTDPVSEIRKLKQESGPDMTIMGSGQIIAQLAQEKNLIDEYQIIVKPKVLGDGRTLFEGVKERLTFQLKKSRVFDNGNVLLCYEPLG